VKILDYLKNLCKKRVGSMIIFPSPQFYILMSLAEATREIKLQKIKKGMYILEVALNVSRIA
jgi:hypothetical protein